MKTQLIHKFEDIISIENLLEAWKEFARGKRGKTDVQEFSINLMDNLFLLHNDLTNFTYKHGGVSSIQYKRPQTQEYPQSERPRPSASPRYIPDTLPIF